MLESIKDIEVKSPEILNQNTNNMKKKPLDITTLSEADLKAELERREKDSKAEKRKAYQSYIQDKEDFINDAINMSKIIHNEMLELKEFLTTTGNEINERMYTVKGKDPVDHKKFTIENKDHTLKIEIQTQDRFKFTEESKVHIQAIKDIFKKKFESRNKGFYNLLDDLLMRSNKGEYDPKLLAKVRKRVNELGDPQLTTELSELEKCQEVVGSASYCRAYYKDGKGKWKLINLQFSSL